MVHVKEGGRGIYDFRDCAFGELGLWIEQKGAKEDGPIGSEAV